MGICFPVSLTLFTLLHQTRMFSSLSFLPWFKNKFQSHLLTKSLFALVFHSHLISNVTLIQTLTVVLYVMKQILIEVLMSGSVLGDTCNIWQIILYNLMNCFHSYFEMYILKVLLYLVFLVYLLINYLRHFLLT